MRENPTAANPPPARSEDSPMRRGLKYRRRRAFIDQGSQRSEDSPMRRGLKSDSCPCSLRHAGYRSEDSPMRRGLKWKGPHRRCWRWGPIRRFPDEEGTEIPLLNSASA